MRVYIGGMNDKGYLVLSVSELRSMLKAATRMAHSKGYRGRKAGRYTVVWDKVELTPQRDGAVQVSSHSISCLKHCNETFPMGYAEVARA